jgi:hypothetical protein
MYNKVIFRKYYIGQPAALLKFFMQQKKYLCQNSERDKIHVDRPTIISAEQPISKQIRVYFAK